MAVREAAGGRAPAYACAGNMLFRLAMRRRAVVAGTVLLLVVLAASLVGPFVAPIPPDLPDPANRLGAPGGRHWLGTDHLGRDVFGRLVFGARVTLGVGAAASFLATLAGLALGLAAGFYRHLDAPLMRTMDGLMAFPGIVLALAMVAVLGPKVSNVILALGVVYMPRIARLVRSVILVVRELEFVQAARALGAVDARILVRHVLPSCIPVLTVQVTFIFATAVVAEAALSFLGVGTPPHEPSWGNMLSLGRQYLYQAPWLTLFPGFAIMLTVLGLNTLGDGLQDLLDPRLRGA